MNLSIEIETQVNTESWLMLKIHEGWRQQKEAPFKIHFKKKIRMHSILDNTLRHTRKKQKHSSTQIQKQSSFWWLLLVGYCATSQRSDHLKLVSRAWQQVHCTPMNPTEHLWDVAEWDNCIDKSAAAVWCFHVSMDQNVRGTFPATSWIYATKNHSSSENKTEANLVLPRCKW